MIILLSLAVVRFKNILLNTFLSFFVYGHSKLFLPKKKNVLQHLILIWECIFFNYIRNDLLFTIVSFRVWIKVYRKCEEEFEWIDIPFQNISIIAL